jgi:hypothetical protein
VRLNRLGGAFMYIQVIEDRIKELKELISRTPIRKTFTLQARLVEAEHILSLLNLSILKK